MTGMRWEQKQHNNTREVTGDTAEDGGYWVCCRGITPMLCVFSIRTSTGTDTTATDTDTGVYYVCGVEVRIKV